MMHFETYQGEDHVPRGSWKFNLAVGALAFGLIAAALPDHSGGRSANGSIAAKPAAGMNAPLDVTQRIVPAAYTGSTGKATWCQDQYADS